MWLRKCSAAFALAAIATWVITEKVVADNPSALVNNSTPVVGAVNGNCLYNNNGTLGNQSCSSGGGGTITTPVSIGNGGTGATSSNAAFKALAPTAVATGDLIYFTGNIWNTLAPGATGSVLMVTANTVAWVASGDTGDVTSVTNADGSLNFNPTTGAVVASLNTANPNTWTAAQTVTNSDLILGGGAAGQTIFKSNNSGATNNTLTMPAVTDFLVAGTSVDTLTNKTIAAASNNLGGVTADFGSDANGDIYYNTGASNVIGRLALGTSGQTLTVTGTSIGWVTPTGGSGSPCTTTNKTVQYDNSGSFGCIGGFTSDGTNLIGAQTATAIAGIVYHFGTSMGAPATSTGLQIAGVVTPVSNPGSTAQGQAYISTTNGLVLQGWGSTNDITLLTHAGTTPCMLTGVSWTCTTIGATQQGSGFTHNPSANTNVFDTFGNGNNGNSSSYQMQLRNNTNAALQTILQFNPTSAATATNGSSAFTIVNTGTGQTYLAGGGNWSNAASIASGGGMTLYNQTTSGSIVFAVCAAAGATNSSGGALILDAGNCIVSNRALKDGIVLLPYDEALNDIEALKPVSFDWKDHRGPRQDGFIAEDVESADSKCANYGGDGKLRGYHTECIVAALTRVVQEQQKEIDDLKRRMPK